MNNLNIVNKLKTKRITFKLFLLTASILFTFAFIIYIILYFFLPTFYNSYKEQQIDIGIQEIVKKSPENKLNEFKSMLDMYASENNATVFILDKDDTMLYTSLSAVFQRAGVSSSTLGTTEAQLAQPAQPIEKELTIRKPTVHSIHKVEKIKFRDGTHQLYVTATLQPIDEVSQVLTLFLPYMSSIVIMIGIVSAYIYSRIITRPLIHINRSARKMAQLDFSQSIKKKSNDELGELSDNLNRMASRLQKSMQELQITNQQLKSDIEKEKYLDKKRRDFFAMVAHELKTPLTILKGHTEGMMYQIGPYINREKYLQQNYQIIENTEKLIREILGISRLEQYTLRPNITSNNISQLMQEIIKNSTFFAEEKQTKCVQKIDLNLWIDTDQNLFETACRNIIHNAIMYSPSGETVYIHVTKEANEPHINLQVINTGVQIAEKDLQQIFLPFYRIEKSRNRNTGGTGLGLYSVKQIFEVLNIKYSIHNVEHGVEFLAKIPIDGK
ncbi:HAMP domain-containing sensor histidine kinase [Bacillus wiedmannii]|uniref:HAMP domain-containing sensor histidine kinase n=1 Tax=Bacillus wiedmannii TaxID=1890302 RepID=UPI000BF22CA1|nr:HAMP domain-containing sensor histidine kinase [Bacillus wiedmannii]PEO40901.1 two-component sensor histidine kinase [Bacillus wiedmannii]